MGEHKASTDLFRWGLLIPLLPDIKSLDLTEDFYSIRIQSLSFTLTKVNNYTGFVVYIQIFSNEVIYIEERIVKYNCSTLIFNGDVIAVGLNCQKVYKFRMFVDVDFWLPKSLREKYILGRMINMSDHKTVYNGKDKKKSKAYIIKKLYNHNKSFTSSIISNLTELEHPFCNTFHKIVMHNEAIFVLTKFNSFGNLSKLQNEDMCESHIRLIFYQMVIGVRFLHFNKILHGSLKPENVLITRLTHYYIPKITDYGLADKVNTPITEFTNFVAPEVAQGISGLAPSSDVWSLGEILYFIVCKRYPFDGKDRMLKIACYNAVNNLDGDIFPDTVDSLLGKMLWVCCDERICLDDVDTHPWIAKDLLIRKVIDQPFL